MYKLRFPILTAAEIQSQLKNIHNLNFITEDDITKPKLESLKMIYIRILMLIHKDLTLDSFNTSESEKKRLRFSDSHESSIPTIRLFKFLSTLLSEIGCKEDQFKLYDLLKPDYKRTRYYLSALINYLKFIDEELNVKMNNNETFIKNKQKSDELNSVTELMGKLQSEVESLNAYFKDKNEEISKKNLQVEELEKDKKSVLEQKKKIEEGLQGLTLENESLDNNIALLNSSVSEAINLQKVLKSRVVENGEDLLNTLETKRTEFENLKTTSKKEKEISNNLDIGIEKNKAILSKLSQIELVIGNCQIQYAKFKETIAYIEELKREGLMLERKCIQQNLQFGSDLAKLKNESMKREVEKNNFESRICSIEGIIEGKKLEIKKFNEDIEAGLSEYGKKNEVLEGMMLESQEGLRKKGEVEEGLNEELAKVNELGKEFLRGIEEIASSSVFFKPLLRIKVGDEA